MTRYRSQYEQEQAEFRRARLLGCLWMGLTALFMVFVGWLAIVGAIVIFDGVTP